ncbi:MAG TPA: hypothetical protein VM493_11485 [Vicinamibacterales bacterium]|nr:hypothetical protein [Vicinamibacterales bacterium]
MNAQRLAFLDALEADMAAPPAIARSSKKSVRKGSAFAAVLFASASFFALSASPAAAGEQTVLGCMDPNPVPRNHSKTCTGLDIQRFDYTNYSYNPVPHIICYVFDHWSFTCNTWYYVDETSACTR